MNLTSKTPALDNNPFIKVLFVGNHFESYVDMTVVWRKEAPAEFVPNNMGNRLNDKNQIGESFVMGQDKLVALQMLSDLHPMNEKVHSYTLHLLHTAQIDKLIKYEFQKHQSDFTYIQVFWNWSFHFYFKDPIFVVSLQGHPQQITLTNKANATIRMYWLHDKLFQTFNNLHTTREGCLEVLPNTYSYCLNISYFSAMNNQQKTKNYLFLRTSLFTPVFSKEKIQYVSWNMAQKTCRLAGGYLPILRDKNELNELVAIITFFPYLPVVDEIHIGLKMEHSFTVIPEKKLITIQVNILLIFRLCFASNQVKQVTARVVPPYPVTDFQF